ncbi:SLATT domain-containing protein [Streptomyces sp. P9-2B-2]|uniref:SLATT domain-containing protein n=1 Tax=Streptomyces sp. P9-2B-2 TaxID=3057114 RepID=UPI0025B33D71|nr:SLATT domain-containing protein [Streptomyces sp. P9-2B-2]WJY39528.1 SLATT domain-containing protein [Streptomyces sp. P9-2B-2]
MEPAFRGKSQSMTEPVSATTDALIEHRRKVADLQQRIKNRRLQALGLYGTSIAALLTALVWPALKIFFWLNADMPSAINITLGGLLLFLVLATAAQIAAEFYIDPSPWRDNETPVKDLKLDLELAEEQRVLEARRLTPPTPERQASYKERVPGEIARLRLESQHYRRLHLFMQWMLFLSSAAISAVTAWYDPPQPAKGVLIALGFTVTVITAAAGYFKPRERAFNLQQTADSMEQHATALELGIAPYTEVDDRLNLASFATTVEALRAEQRMREQQLDQPQQASKT